jgi:hypothetical protein
MARKRRTPVSKGRCSIAGRTTAEPSPPSEAPGRSRICASEHEPREGMVTETGAGSSPGCLSRKPWHPPSLWHFPPSSRSFVTVDQLENQGLLRNSFAGMSAAGHPPPIRCPPGASASAGQAVLRVRSQMCQQRSFTSPACWHIHQLWPMQPLHRWAPPVHQPASQPC